MSNTRQELERLRRLKKELDQKKEIERLKKEIYKIRT